MPGLRVISGTARGRRLQMVPGDTTRPIADRAKQALFNVLGGQIVDAAVMDLFAGTGSVGIEALSRGAASATFVERERAAVSTIQANLRATGLADKARVLRADVFIHLRNNPQHGFDYIHVAPPQYKDMWSDAIMALDSRPAWINPDGIVVAQVDPLEFKPLELQHLQLVDERRYGNTLLAFYERPGE
jgi:16S rRNA (guanine966-N2)-methyltransferase